MAASTPTGQQDPADSGFLAYHASSWRTWEQTGGIATSPAFVPYAADPAAHYTWRQARSAANVGKPG